jgi:hypothetical protein
MEGSRPGLTLNFNGKLLIEISRLRFLRTTIMEQ